MDKLREKLANINVDSVAAAKDGDVKKLREDLIRARTEISPFAQNISELNTSDLLAIQIIPMSRDYQIKLLLTSLVGFLFTAADEYNVPDDVPVINVPNYLADPTLIDPPDDVNEDMKEQYAKNKREMEKRVIIYEFLLEHLSYNPNKHARSAYNPSAADKTRKPIISAAAELALFRNLKAAMKSKEFKPEEREVAKEKYDRYEEMKANPPPNAVVVEPKDHEIFIEAVVKGRDGSEKLIKKRVKVTKTKYDEWMKKRGNPVTANEVAIAETKRVIPLVFDPKDYLKIKERAATYVPYQTIPPNDTLWKFNNYFEQHYDSLLEATKNIYDDQPDFDWAAFPHKIFHAGESKAPLEQFKDYKNKYQRQIKWPIVGLNVGRWSLFGPYKENRDRMQFFGANMGIFDEMFKHREMDARIARELVSHRAKGKRTKMQERHGKVKKTDLKAIAATDSLAGLGVAAIEDADDSADDEDVEIRVTEIKAGRVQQGKIFVEGAPPEDVKMA
jgi:hypothetical protein